jgi:hypothetical protein
MPSPCCGSLVFNRFARISAGVHQVARLSQRAAISCLRVCVGRHLNRRTAQLLWPIEQGGSHSHLRQITDRHWLDLLDRNGPGCGVLMAGDAVLAGCIRLPDAGEAGFLELMRDVAWDPRLDQALPHVLNGSFSAAAPAGCSRRLTMHPSAGSWRRRGGPAAKSSCCSDAACGGVSHPSATCS